MVNLKIPLRRQNPYKLARSHPPRGTEGTIYYHPKQREHQKVGNPIFVTETQSSHDLEDTSETKGQEPAEPNFFPVTNSETPYYFPVSNYHLYFSIGGSELRHNDQYI